MTILIAQEYCTLWGVLVVYSCPQDIRPHLLENEPSPEAIHVGTLKPAQQLLQDVTKGV